MKNIIFKLIYWLTQAVKGLGIGRIKPFFDIYRYAIALTKPRKVLTRGGWIILDDKDSLLLSVFPDFSPGITKVITKNIKEGMTVIDAGAHIGFFTLLLAKLVGESGKVYAIEPNGANLKLLTQNVKSNGYKNVEIIRGAVTDKGKKVKLNISNESTSEHKITSANNENFKRFEYVDAVVLDKLAGSRKIDFIKMDIQGAEILAFCGATKLLKRSKNLKMIIEFWPWGLHRSGKSPNELITILKKYGTLRLLDAESGKLSKLADQNYEKYINDKYYGFDLFFERKM